MSTASTFRALTEIALSRFAAEDPNDPYAAAYPTFRTFTPLGGPVRDEVVLLRRSAASAPTARLIINAPGGLFPASENDIPAVFRALNPMSSPGTRGFPTFSYGRSGVKQYINVVTLRPGFKIIFMPPATSPNPSNVEAFIAAAQAFARANGSSAGLPTFNLTPQGHEVIAFSTGTVVNSNPPVVPGVPGVPGPPPSGGWLFRSLPVINDGGLAITSDGVNPLLFIVLGGQLVQYNPSPTQPSRVQVDPFVDGSRRALSAITSQVSAIRTGGRFHVIWSDRALFHATRTDGTMDSVDNFMFRTASGRTAPEPTGIVGYFNHLASAPNGILHALAYLSQPPGVPHTPSPDDMVGFNLLHLVFDGTRWSEEIVDGEAVTMMGHVIGNAGQASSLAFEPNGTMHAFYTLIVESTTVPGTLTQRLRHAERTAAGWIAKTLDGSGANAPPVAWGIGPARASVGEHPTAVYFDGALWAIYEDRTWGNLRCARGKRNAGGTLEWDFHVVDGSVGKGRGRTSGIVQHAVAVLWDNTLSLFYRDLSRGVIRHAWRNRGDSQWRYELLDGAGGPDGRINTAAIPEGIAACAGGRRTDGTPTRPVFVTYRWTAGTTPTNVRLATLS